MPTDPEEAPQPDPDGVPRSVVERRIAEAMAGGEFDDLPGAGRPIPGLDASYDPAWWAKRWVERHRLLERQTELLRSIDRERLKLSVPSLADDARERIDALEEELAPVDDRLTPGERSGHGPAAQG
jgi:hypothetical protein